MASFCLRLGFEVATDCRVCSDWVGQQIIDKMSNQIRASSSLIRRLKQQMSNPAVLIQTRSFTPSEGQRPVIVHKRSLDILHDPWFNKVCSLMTFNFFSILWSFVILFVVCYSFVLFNLSPKKKKKKKSCWIMRFLCLLALILGFCFITELLNVYLTVLPSKK